MTRMPALIIAAALLAACASAPPATSPAPSHPDAAVRAVSAPEAALSLQLDSIARAAYPADAPGAAILVRRGDQVLLRAGYGMASLELGVPVQPEHVFRIGSVTKQFTAAAILRLAEQGKLSLEDDITRFFPDWPSQGRRISVEALLNHTSGIASYTGLPRWRGVVRQDLQLDSLIALFRDEPMDFAPGEQWRYNNSAYVLLGAIIERASGRSYEEYVEQEFFEPLGMTDSRFGHVEELVPGMANGYQRARGGWAPATYLSMTQPHAAGSLLSTVDDLDRWIDALREGRVLSEASRRRAWMPGRLTSGLNTGYGYGWFVGHAFGRPTVEHSGGIFGFSAFQLWLPEDDVRVYVLANSQAPPRAPGAVALDLVHAVLGRPAAAAPIAVEPGALQQYVGVYQLDEARREVLRRGDTLFTREGNAEPVRLVPVARDEFLVAGSQTRLTFERPAGGPVAGVRVRPRIGAEARGPRVADAPVERPSIQLSAAVLDRYVGTYQVTPGLQITVTREGNGLVSEPTGQPSRPLRAVSETEFEVIGVDARLVFQVDAAGPATAFVLHQGGRSVTAPRIR